MSNGLIIPLLVVCVILSAFFSMSEMVYAKVNKVRLAREADNKIKAAILANSFANDLMILLLLF